MSSLDAGAFGKVARDAGGQSMSAAKRLSFLGLVIVLVLLVLEAGIRVSHGLRGKAPPHFDPSVEYEWQWALEHVRLGTSTFEGYGVFHPKLGWVTRSNLERDGVRTNGAGIRADREIPLAGDPYTVRILFVGDSYTFGSNVSNEHAFPEVFQRRFLADGEVINLGVPGYAVDQAVLLYETIGTRYSPNIVVLGFFVRDFYRNLLRFRGYQKPRFELGEGDSLRIVGLPILPPQQLYEAYASGERIIGGWHYSHLFTKLANKITRSMERREIDANSESWRLMAAILRRFRDHVRASKAKPFLLVLPNRLDGHIGSSYEMIDQMAMAEALALGMPALSMTETFQNEAEANPSDSLYQERDVGGHLSIRGNELVAEKLFEVFQSLGWTWMLDERASPKE